MNNAKLLARLEAQYDALTSKAPLKVKAELMAQIRALRNA